MSSARSNAIIGAGMVGGLMLAGGDTDVDPLSDLRDEFVETRTAEPESSTGPVSYQNGTPETDLDELRRQFAQPIETATFKSVLPGISEPVVSDQIQNALRRRGSYILPADIERINAGVAKAGGMAKRLYGEPMRGEEKLSVLEKKFYTILKGVNALEAEVLKLRAKPIHQRQQTPVAPLPQAHHLSDYLGGTQ